MTIEDYELLKLFYKRLTAADFTRRAENETEARHMMYAMGSLMEELKTGRATIDPAERIERSKENL